MNPSAIVLDTPAPTAAADGRPHWWLAAMLLALHAGSAWGVEQMWTRGFMLAHFGLFLLWQPLWRGELRVTPVHAVLVVACGAALAASTGWWVLAFWLALIFGLLGGRATGTSDKRTRAALVLAAAYVLALLLAWVVPHLFGRWQPEEALLPAVRFGLPLLPLAIVLLPLQPGRTGQGSAAIDLFYAALLFLVVVALVLGSFALRAIGQGSYFSGLMQMLFGLAALLGVLSWLWNPHGGYAGLQQLVSRYVAGIGLPFERWIAELARLAAVEPAPERFMALALEAMRRSAHIPGVDWRCERDEASVGAPARHELRSEIRAQQFVFHLRAAPSAALALHFRLLAETLACFYEAKQRERRERVAAYERAIHETGARITHDVKNVLQAVRGLCVAAEEARAEDDGALAAMVKRQLPALAQRMQGTLEKLQAPAAVHGARVPAALWWEGVQRRYAGREVAFERCEAGEDVLLPAELFDGVADNLVANAVGKSAPPPAVRIAFDASQAALTVTDDGAAVPAQIASVLLRDRVPSGGGLGVGLYHCARHAEQLGYRLSLVSNVPGEVRFELRPVAPGPG